MSRDIPRHKLEVVAPLCVECGGMGRIVSGATAYPDKPEWRTRPFYRCGCGALVSCHPGTGVPMGRPASARTRYLRHKAHAALDALWSTGRSRLGSGFARTKAYKWLARELGMPHREVHIGMMGAALLNRVIAICTAETDRRNAA